MTTLFVPRERQAGERRVAVTPDSVHRFANAGVEVAVEAGAGGEAGHTDQAYQEAGATIANDRAGSWGAADLVAVVAPPPAEDVARMREGAVLVGLLAAHRNLDLVRVLTDQKVTSFSMEQLPRITRTQRMDALSSQASVAGYRAAIVAAHRLEKHLPLLMTAAGTIRPGTVIVLGTGVAGLQAIATARRLGAVVRANDIRANARAESESLGAEFIELEEDVGGQDASGYAREVGEDTLTKQRRILGEHFVEADAVITTALVPGRPAPELITTEMVERMPAGSVVVDLAAAEGGNCVLTDPSREVDHHGVRIVPGTNLPADLPGEASALYARNVYEFASLLLSEGGELRVDRDDEVVAATLLTADGTVEHEPTANLLREHQEGAS